MEDLCESTVRVIRSILTSTKGGVSMSQLKRDYGETIGGQIPYSRLGYPTLESFLADQRAFQLFPGPDGATRVDARLTKDTAHISELVGRQKNSAPKRGKAFGAPRQTNRGSRRVQGIQLNPQTRTSKWRPSKPVFDDHRAPQQQQQQPSSGGEQKRRSVGGANHSQFVAKKGSGEVKRSQVKVASKVVVPAHSGFVAEPLKESEEETSGGVTSSCRMRIAKKMSELSLERDSGNSSPTIDESPPTPQPEVQSVAFVPTGDHLADLSLLAETYKLGEVTYKFGHTCPKGSKRTEHWCQIKVGTAHSYRSYPKEFYSKQEAESYVARLAVEDLMSRYGRRRSLLLSSVEDILERIPPMIQKHQGAVWMWQVEADYVDIYKEQLPTNWLQVVDSSPWISIEMFHGGFVLQHCDPKDKDKKIGPNLQIGEVSVPCNTVKFEQNNRLFAVILNAISVHEIWCQQCDIPEYDGFYNMMDDLAAYYGDNRDRTRVGHVTANSYYVVYVEDEWFRAKALHDVGRSEPGGVVKCFLIDVGVEAPVPIGDVHALSREYAVQPAQAFVVRLVDLDEFYVPSIKSEPMQELRHRVFILEMVSEEDKVGDQAIPVVMYTQDPPHGNVNQELICALICWAAKPILSEQVLNEVFVSNIESNGDVYVQIHSSGYTYLQQMLLEINRKLDENEITVTPTTAITPQNSGDVVYLVKHNVTNDWRRASILDWSPKQDLVQIYYVDYGNTCVVKLNAKRMLPLVEIDEVVAKIPPQAVRVRIMIEVLPKDFVERAERLMPASEGLLLKIVNYDSAGLPWVEFYKRTSEAVLFCNKSIALQMELEISDVSQYIEQQQAKTRLMSLVGSGENSNKNVPSGGSLPKPNLPKGKGEYFNVNVPLSVNPWNFIVQPLDSLGDLTDMMREMQERYKKVEFSPLQIDDVVPGNIYASQYEDGQWYRTSVLKVINTGSISVYYCDFGFYNNLKLHQLIPIDVKFLTLPYQALKAKLAGIKPLKNKWTMEDCEFFNSLVARKQFVSVLVDIEKDELYRSDNVLKLILIDTTSSRDVNVGDLLISKSIAIESSDN